MKENRKGFALGAIVALLASLFGAVPAATAAATDGANIAIRPVSGTTFGGTVVEDFPVYAQLLPGQSNASFSSKVYWKIEKTSGTDMDLLFRTGPSAVSIANDATSASVTVDEVAAGATSKSVAVAASSMSPSGPSYISVKAYSSSGVASWSAVTVKLTVWIDEVTNGASAGALDADEWFTTQTITLYHPTAIPATLTLADPTRGDTKVTVSATVTGINFENLAGKFVLQVSSSANIYTTSSGQVSQDFSSPLGGTTLQGRAGVVSTSFTVTNVTESDSVSFALFYDESGAGGVYDQGYQVGSTVTKGVANPGITALTARVVAGDHSTASGTTAHVRPNQTYTIRIAATSNSTSVSKAVTVELGGTALSWPSKVISVNGAADTSSYPTALAVTTGTDGFATFTIKATGFAVDNTITVKARAGNVEADLLTLTMKAPYYTVANAYDLVVTTPGTAVTLDYTVKDQWQVLSAETNQRLYLTKGGSGFNYAATVAAVAVVGGKASFAFTPEAATKTGSASVTSALQSYTANTLTWAADATAINDSAVTVNVTSTADSFTTAPTATVSASVSYAVASDAYSWSGAITGYVANAGQAVVVSAPGLIFQDTVTEATASDTITVRANSSGVYSVKAASEISGTYVVTFTTGASSTTSRVVISAPGSDQGVAINWDTTNIVPGKTKIVTGTLVDANGNGVYTDNYGNIDNDATTASILVTYAGTAGIPVGTMPTETDADGKFKVSVLTSTADSGTFTLTAVYNPHGTSTTTVQKVTSVASITVGAEAVAADQKITVGTFKGYVAIYTKGYMGQKLSAKVAGKWLVVDPIVAYKSNDYSRTVRLTGAGYTITVDLYIDGVFVRSEVVTTK